MIKKIYSLVAIACVLSSLHAENSLLWFEVKPGYFFFSNHILRKIYHHGGFEIQGSVTYPWCENIALYGSLGYLHVQGRSLQGHQPISISQVPVDVGLRAIAHVNEWVKSYLTIGPRFFYFHQHNDSIYVPRNIRKTGLGFFINSGCNVVRNDCFLLGIFGEYAFERKSFKSTIPNVYGRQDLQIGGFTFGANLGFEF